MVPTPTAPSSAAPAGDGAASSATAPARADEPAPAQTPAPAQAADPTACVRSLLPPDAFVQDAKPDLGFVCTQTNPRKGSSALKKRIVIGGNRRGTTNAMREWSMLGWYEMPAFVSIRAACCPNADPVKLVESTRTRCDTFASVLDDLGRAVLQDAPEPTEEALSRYTRTIYCAFAAGTAPAFGPAQGPTGGEDTTFRKLLARVKARPRP
jgi:hypothetical protein